MHIYVVPPKCEELAEEPSSGRRKRRQHVDLAEHSHAVPLAEGPGEEQSAKGCGVPERR